MPKVPYFGTSPEADAQRATASASMKGYKPMPAAEKGPSDLQKTAARRVKRLYQGSMGFSPDERYRENMLGPKKSGGPITWEMEKLKNALALAAKVGEAHGEDLSPRHAALLASLTKGKP
jgi:hypothetical protein